MDCLDNVPWNLYAIWCRGHKPLENTRDKSRIVGRFVDPKEGRIFVAVRQKSDNVVANSIPKWKCFRVFWFLWSNAIEFRVSFSDNGKIIHNCHFLLLSPVPALIHHVNSGGLGCGW